MITILSTGLMVSACSESAGRPQASTNSGSTVTSASQTKPSPTNNVGRTATATAQPTSAPWSPLPQPPSNPEETSHSQTTSESPICPIPEGPKGPGIPVTPETKPEDVPYLVLETDAVDPDIEFRGVQIAPRIVMDSIKVNAWWRSPNTYGIKTRANCKLEFSRDGKLSIKGEYAWTSGSPSDFDDTSEEAKDKDIHFQFKSDDSDCTHERHDDPATKAITIRFSCQNQIAENPDFEGELYVPASVKFNPAPQK